MHPQIPYSQANSETDHANTTLLLLEGYCGGRHAHQ